MSIRKDRFARSSRSTSSEIRSRSVTPDRSSNFASAARRALLLGLVVVTTDPQIESSPKLPTDPQIESPPPLSKETSPLRLDVLERVEAMDMSEEEAEEMMMSNPGHVRRWVDFAEGGAQEHSLLKSPIPSISKVSDVYRSTSDEVCEGSDLDSEFDDEFDAAPIETTALTARRDIPDDEDLEEPVRDLINAVESAMDDEVDLMLGISSSFDWVEGFDTFRGIPEQFSGPTPGPVKDYDTPYDCFIEIFDKAIIESIAQETNRYAKQTIDSLKANDKLTASSRLHQWTDTDADEILLLFAVYMYMGIDPRTSQNEYWRSNDFLEMPKFKRIMTYNRYVLLSKFLHFVDNSASVNKQQNSQLNEEVISPKPSKLAPIIIHLNSKFSSIYNLARDISIDESLTLFKGRLSWVQTIRSKAARFGIKSYELCESRTGYMYKFQIYTGKNDSADVPPSIDLGGKSTKVVLDLLKSLEHLGHCVTMDNFYNSPALARYLKSLGFDCLGTLRVNRRNVPSDIAKVPKNVAKGTIVARHCGDVSIIAWKDWKVVTMISTYHDDDTYVGSRAGRVFVKPICVRDYNNTMGGVDLKNQKLSMYLLERKRGLKWYLKIFKRLLNVSIHNAFVMYVGSLRRRNILSMTHREFRYCLAKSLVVKHCPTLPEISQPVGQLMRLRKDVTHVPKYETGRNNRKRCKNCYRKKIDKMVHSQCVTCDVFLCFETCWSEWHNVVDLKTPKTRGLKRRRDKD